MAEAQPPPLWASPAVIERLKGLLRANEHKSAIQASRALAVGLSALLDDLQEPTSISLLELWPAAAEAVPYVWHADAKERLVQVLTGER